jgi:hypothetical protein
LREELHTEIERVLNDVIHFKIHIQKKLEDYENFVDEEVSREVAGENADSSFDDDAAAARSPRRENDAEFGAADLGDVDDR